MNGNVRYELAKVMIADRQREARHAHTVAQARAARREHRAVVRSGATVARRVRVMLRPRTA